jgi:hydrogenase nickel incorporation protein HypA/HybF
MHEMTLAENVLLIIEEQARKACATRVLSVRLEIGQLSHVEPEALSFCYDAAARGSCAEGSALILDKAPGRAFCHGCNEEVTVEGPVSPCPQCGGFGLEVTGGQEMRVKDMEVE